MSRPVRKPAALAATVALLLTGCSAGPGPDQDPQESPAPEQAAGEFATLEDFQGQELSWTECDGAFECATLTVPLDYAEPGGKTIELALLRSPATSGESTGSLVVNPGGPGASGVDYARAGAMIASPEVLATYDVVGFDPRGVADSSPVDCLDDAELDAYLNADATPADEADVEALLADVESFVNGCEENSGDLLPHVGTANVARDLDVLRAALGDEQLTYLGKSYGTVIGATYAELFPERAGRLVLDGALDPALSSREVSLGQAAGFELALNAYLGWCFEQESCALGSTNEEARANLDALFEQVAAEPLETYDADRPLSSSLLLYGVILPLYLPAAQGYPLLENGLAAALDGDGAGMLQLADFYLARNPDGSFEGNQNEAMVAVNCLDRPEQVTVAEVEAGLEDFRAASPLFGEFLAWGGLTCSAWPVASDAEPAPIAAEGADPILVVGTTGDPATPYAWSQALAEQLESGVLLTYEAAVHTAYRQGSACVDDIVDAYLLEDTVPEAGVTCA